MKYVLFFVFLLISSMAFCGNEQCDINNGETFYSCPSDCSCGLWVSSPPGIPFTIGNITINVHEIISQAPPAIKVKFSKPGGVGKEMVIRHSETLPVFSDLSATAAKPNETAPLQLSLDFCPYGSVCRNTQCVRPTYQPLSFICPDWIKRSDKVKPQAVLGLLDTLKDYENYKLECWGPLEKLAITCLDDPTNCPNGVIDQSAVAYSPEYGRIIGSDVISSCIKICESIGPQAKCPPGTIECPDGCTNIKEDPENCGACGNVCGPREKCIPWESSYICSPEPTPTNCPQGTICTTEAHAKQMKCELISDIPCLTDEGGVKMYCHVCAGRGVAPTTSCDSIQGICVINECQDGYININASCESSTPVCCIKSSGPITPSNADTGQLVQAMNRLADILERLINLLSSIFGNK